MAGQMVRTIIGPMPRYLLSPEWFSSAVLLVVLIAMLSLEPVIWCLYHGSAQGDLLTRSCPQSDPVRDWYSAISALAVMLHWCLVLLDISIFSTRVGAFLLACRYVATQVALTIAAAFFFVFSFATAINAMAHTLVELDGVQSWVLVLSQITLGTVPSDSWQSLQADDSVQVMVSVFCIIMVTFMLCLGLKLYWSNGFSSLYPDEQAIQNPSYRTKMAKVRRKGSRYYINLKSASR